MSKWWALAVWLVCTTGWFGVALALFAVFALLPLADTHRLISAGELATSPIVVFLLALLVAFTAGIVSIWRSSK